MEAKDFANPVEELAYTVGQVRNHLISPSAHTDLVSSAMMLASQVYYQAVNPFCSAASLVSIAQCAGSSAVGQHAMVQHHRW